MRPEISVVIPVFNEVENVRDLHGELTAALEPLGKPYEILLVDDGSTDGTLPALLAIERTTRACASCACGATSARRRRSRPGSTMPAAT